jgi:hypothetical protein
MMLKRIVLVALAVTALVGLADVPTVNAVEIIGGAAGGYVVGGPTTNSTVYTATAGTLVKTFNENAKLYTVARMSGNEDQDTKWGATAIFATRLPSAPWVWGLLSASGISDAFVNGDGTTDPAFAVGAGLSAGVTPNLSLSLYIEATRVSGDAWERILWFAPSAHFEL